MYVYSSQYNYRDLRNQIIANRYIRTLDVSVLNFKER